MRLSSRICAGSELCGSPEKHRNSVLRDFHTARISASRGYLPLPGMAVCRRRLRLPKLLIRFPSPARPTFRLWSARYLGRLRPGRTFEIPPWESCRANAAPSVAKLPFRSSRGKSPPSVGTLARWRGTHLTYSSGIPCLKARTDGDSDCIFLMTSARRPGMGDELTS
jgi:hypothetical protein